MTIDEAVDLVRRARAGERRALSRIVTDLETAAPAQSALITALTPHLGHAFVVGFTGPPGAGKSTLVDAYARRLRAQGRSVGIIAVDPSSPLSGGAILGDRIRMAASLEDDGVYMRSLASRGVLGGLSPAAVRVIDALDGSGKDVIILETVGTGQSEIDVAAVADVRVVLAAPGLGDGIQAMKSGLLDIADLLVVNQADRPGAEQTHQQLRSALSLRTDRRDVPVLQTIAVSGQGVDALSAAIDDVGRAMLRVAVHERRRRRARLIIARAASECVAEALAREQDIAALADAVLAGSTDARAAAQQLLAVRDRAK
jgi:LAO/AO transport system kinase